MPWHTPTRSFARLSFVQCCLLHRKGVGAMSHFAQQVAVGVCRAHNALSQFQCDPHPHPHDLAPAAVRHNLTAG
jgi:hypothetical protein